MNLRALTLCSLSAAALVPSAAAQSGYTFSIDWNSTTVGTAETCGGTPITEGDILRPAVGVVALGPLTTPCIAISGGIPGLGLAFHGACVGHPGGTPCRVEVDALSYGVDEYLSPNSVSNQGYIFSTDEFAQGGVGPLAFPSLPSEQPVGDAAADVWVQAAPLPPGPLPPLGGGAGHVGLVDGDGMMSPSGAVYPGTGLVEPTLPGIPGPGDDLDALDYAEFPSAADFPQSGAYFSLDAGFFDPLTGFPHSNSAVAHGFSPADVLFTLNGGTPPVVWAPASLLGLDLTPGGRDDLDALAIWENGNGVFDPSKTPYDWGPGGADMVLFSVRRGSPVIGLPDSIFGLPICEGDILTTPLDTALGGVSPFPGIFCAAENLGLRGRGTGNFADDLNALDTRKLAFDDCNGNGVPDGVDISTGTSTDADGDGVPDECQVIGQPFCFCPAALAPCGNPSLVGGCSNSTGLGALLGASGSSSVANDDLVLVASQLPPSRPSLFFFGTVPVGPLPFGDGLRCAGGSIKRFGLGLNSPAGLKVSGTGICAAFGILPGMSPVFQVWTRDPGGPCGTNFNTTNAYQVVFTP